MAKFLGVISNSANSSCDQKVLEFSDLELLSDCLLIETENLYCEFSQKLKLINDQELIVLENASKLTKVYECLHVISSKMILMENEINEMGNCLSQMEAAIHRMQYIPNDFACRCSSNKERNRILNMLVQLSEHIQRMEYQIEETKEYECEFSTKDMCSWIYRFKPFLELHNRILLLTENKLSRVSGLLTDIEEIFFQLNRRLMCGHLHKEQHRNVSDC